MVHTKGVHCYLVHFNSFESMYYDVHQISLRTQKQHAQITAVDITTQHIETGFKLLEVRFESCKERAESSFETKPKKLNLLLYD